MKLKSPAKVNLFLNVLFKRKDGFHEIETLFERISLCDEIELLPRPGGIRIETLSPDIPKGPSNTAYRAAKLLKEEFGVGAGLCIRIRKRIPVSAGLGGGSSNAASVLLGLNRLWKLRLSRKKLLGLASRLGSDVAFFVQGSSCALGRGRGEILRKINPPKARIWHCLVKPDFGVSTHAAYGRLTGVLSRSSASAGRHRSSFLTPSVANAKMLLHSIYKGHSETLSKLLTNSLEAALNKRVRKTLNRIKTILRNQGALGCLMSGSGSCVFGIFVSKEGAQRAARAFRAHKNWRVFVASTL